GRDEARRRLGLDPGATAVGLLPGSRREEVARLLPLMLSAARQLRSAGAAERFFLGLPPTGDTRGGDRIVERGGEGTAPPGGGMGLRLRAAGHLLAAGVGERFLRGLAPTADRRGVDRIIGEAAKEALPSVRVLDGQTYEVMAGADVILPASGTATLETALLGT